PYDVVFLDWQMPGMDGLETATRLRERLLSRSPVVIMVTAFGRHDLLRLPQAAQVADVLDKPVSLASVTASARRALRLAPAERPGAGAASAAAAPVARSVVPASPALAPRLAAPATEPALPVVLQGLSMLVVEDNEVNSLVATEVLRAAGMRVEVAVDGARAVARLRDGAPVDMVLMDMHMPVMGGVDATAAIRALPGITQPVIVAMTGSVLEEDRRRCLAAGMDDFLTKPLDPPLLYQVLAGWAVRARSSVPE
ncbi:MAG: response regulator, partial [Comamonadaceae bacterium]